VTGSKHAASPPASREKGSLLPCLGARLTRCASPWIFERHFYVPDRIAYFAKDLQIESQHHISWTYSDQALLALEAERRGNPRNLLTLIH
jgi:hypothetical protein